MAARPAIFFPHRKTTDGSYISICLSCYETVARSQVESRLEEHEKRHVCDSFLLTERGRTFLPAPISRNTQQDAG